MDHEKATGAGTHSTPLLCTFVDNPLLCNFVDGVVDYKGRPVLRSNSGGWRSASFIISVEVAERFAYYGVSSNLITYLTGPLGQSTATAAENVSVWSGTAKLLPLVGAFIADAFLGRYLTIILASLLYVLLQVIMFFVSLYLDKMKYIEDNLSWGLGFGIPCIIMGFALIMFMIGTVTYRFVEKTEEKSAFLRIGHVFVKAAKNWQTTPSRISSEEEETSGILRPHQNCQQFRFLNNALCNGINEDGSVCSIDDVEEAKSLLRLFPIWVSCLGYAIVFAQTTTFFTKQGATMDRSIGPTFQIPAATLQSFIGVSVIILVVVEANK